jgi:negative regulator of sigma-B (phosphoserine phosphatase)
MQDRIETGKYVRPCDGETLSGDAVLVQPAHGGVLAAVIDVLGHGPVAHELAMQLSAILLKWLLVAPAPSPEGSLAVLHEAAHGTRGAVAAVAWLDGHKLEGSVAGIGNVRCRLFGSNTRTVMFGDGVLGSRMRSLTPAPFVLQPGDAIVLFSDGVTDRFSINEYPTLTLDPAPAIAFNIVRRFGKGHDDASCAVLRCRS